MRVWWKGTFQMEWRTIRSTFWGAAQKEIPALAVVIIGGKVRWSLMDWQCLICEDASVLIEWTEGEITALRNFDKRSICFSYTTFSVSFCTVISERSVYAKMHTYSVSLLANCFVTYIEICAGIYHKKCKTFLQYFCGCMMKKQLRSGITSLSPPSWWRHHAY